MDREIKNMDTKRKILESSIKEFALHGYEAASLNVICRNGEISKGIIYHYFDSKEDLYISCLSECFDKLTDYLKLNIHRIRSEDLLAEYFNLRMSFFKMHDEYAQLFCEAVLFAPFSLKDKIHAARSNFDELNQSIFAEIISDKQVRDDINEKDILAVLEQLQDFLNAGYRNAIGNKAALVEHERKCQNALQIFLYGIIKR